MRIPAFTSTDVRPAMLGARARVSGEKLNNIIREINKRNRITLSAYQIRYLNDVPSGAVLSERGEVLLRGRQSNFIPDFNKDIEEFKPGEEITADRLNEIVNALNRMNRLAPKQEFAFRPNPNLNIDYLSGVTTYPAGKSNLKAGPISAASSNPLGTDSQRIWYRFKEAIDAYELFTNMRTSWYCLRGTILKPYGNPGSYWTPTPVLVTKDFNIKSITHNNAPESMYLYVSGIDVNYCSPYTWQPSSVGSGSGVGFDLNYARKVHYFDLFTNSLPVDVYLNIGTNTTSVLDVNTGLTTLGINQLRGAKIVWDDEARIIESNTASTIYLKTPFTTIPDGGFTPLYAYPIIYGIYIYLQSPGGDYVGTGIDSIVDMELENYEPFI